MSRCEVTQDVWEKFMWRRKDLRFNGTRYPAIGVTWDHVQEFVGKLNKTAGPKAHLNFRLPTEAEWEWACRAGTDTAFHFGETITPKLANYGGGLVHAGGVSWDGVVWILPSEGPMEIGHFPANAWGLHDTAGNVSEWVQDVYAPYPETKETLVDPVGPTPEEVKKVQGVVIRVIRGGSWISTPGECQSSASNYYLYHAASSYIGFRLAAEPVR
jgi:formylglycine-generating enzyme required for sulfatase activity